MSFQMVTRYAHSPKDIQHYDTKELRDEFLMEKIFSLGDILLTYTYNDRLADFWWGYSKTRRAIRN